MCVKEKKKRDENEYSHYSEINLLSIPGKMYGKIPSERIKNTENYKGKW